MSLSPPLALVLGVIAPLLALAQKSGSASTSTSISISISISISSSPAAPTKNYIDTISGYHDLSTCAEDVLSTIVRAQYRGCGDNNALTSYTCFCTDSSSFFSSEITAAVSATCDSSIASAQASSAGLVFDAYCALGVEAGLAKTTAVSTASATETPAPAATGSSTTASATATATATVTATSNHSAGTPATGGSSSSSNGVNSAIIAAAVIVPVCIIGLAFMWCLLWRRRRKETRGDRAEKQQELEAMPMPREAPPRRIETIRATTEFKWPPRIGDATPRMTHLQQAPIGPEKEVMVSSPTSMSFHSPSTTTLPPHQNPEYHISPQPFTYSECQRREQLKHKYPAQGLHQTEPAELPHHEIPELSSQHPHELPAATPALIPPQELEGSISPETPRLPRSRFSYQR